jgi:hypothetical protein
MSESAMRIHPDFEEPRPLESLLDDPEFAVYTWSDQTSDWHQVYKLRIGWIEVQFPFNRELIDKIKLIHGHEWHEERKGPNRGGTWQFQVNSLNVIGLVHFFRKNGFLLSKEAVDIIRSAWPPTHKEKPISKWSGVTR